MKYTVEYSVQQQCFHISDLESVLKLNIMNTIENKEINDYKIIAIANKYEDAEDFIKKIKEKMKEGINNDTK